MYVVWSGWNENLASIAACKKALSKRPNEAKSFGECCRGGFGEVHKKPLNIVGWATRRRRVLVPSGQSERDHHQLLRQL